MPIVGHGIDIVEVGRIREMLERHGERFLDRCFTPGERAAGLHARGLSTAGLNPESVPGRRYHEHLAARFAAKEAAMKALGTGLAHGLAWTDCEIVKEAALEGAPKLALHGRARERAQQLGATRWHVSLSHSDTAAIASVILESD
jgi:holo-[acyl-carrier protein] synthase